MNYRLVATEVGELVKWDTSVNEIMRIANALFRFEIETFPNDSITSGRAQTVYNCILSLAKQQMNPDQRNELLVTFCRKIVPDTQVGKLDEILKNFISTSDSALRQTQQEFITRGFHSLVLEHCKELFAQGFYFHSVFEACKVYNKHVQNKAQSTADGEGLMLSVWGCEKGVLKVTRCESETDYNVQDGIKFMSAGLMRAMRNPTAHEPALTWSIDKQDCLDMLSFVSFLFRQLEKAQYFRI